MKMIMNKCIAALALMLVMGAFLFAGNTASAAEFSLNTDVISIEDVWVEGETLNIRILDKRTGQNQTINIAVKEYVSADDEFITVQTVDAEGNVTNTVQIANPIYDPGATADGNIPDIPDANDNAGISDETPPDEPEDNTVESPIPDEYRPLTPDGTGTVVDNVNSSDGKEFFSISTDDGNVFYLIVDRQRDSDNVYLLNAVTEYDLFSLAQEGDGLPRDYPEPPPVAPTEPGDTAQTEPAQDTPAEESGNGGTIVLVVIAVLAAGGVGYYFKIVRPRQEGIDDEFEEDENDDEDTPGSFDDDTEADLEADGDDEEEDESL